jgi:hypothetical protein
MINKSKDEKKIEDIKKRRKYLSWFELIVIYLSWFELIVITIILIEIGVTVINNIKVYDPLSIIALFAFVIASTFVIVELFNKLNKKDTKK